MLFQCFNACDLVLHAALVNGFWVGIKDGTRKCALALRKWLTTGAVQRGVMTQLKALKGFNAQTFKKWVKDDLNKKMLMNRMVFGAGDGTYHVLDFGFEEIFNESVSNSNLPDDIKGWLSRRDVGELKAIALDGFDAEAEEEAVADAARYF